MDASSFYGYAEPPSDDDDDDYSNGEISNSSLSDCDPNFDDEESSSYSESEDDGTGDDSILPATDDDGTEDENILPSTSNVTDIQQQLSQANGNSDWQDTVALPRNFLCTAREEKHYTLPSTSDGEVLPLDVYKLFVTDEIFDLIVIETNRFYDTTAAMKPITRHSKMKAWKPVTKQDIEKFFGIFILMGLNKQPTFESYWSRSKMYGVDLIKTTMARNKFELILRFIHFADNSRSDGSDRLFKLRPLIQLLSRNFKKFTPGEKVVIDESMVLFRGRTILRQYNPSKSHKYGLKVYKLCSVDGYTWEFMIYKGKGDNAPGIEHAEYITRALMDGLLSEGRTLYIDNFYSSVPLSRYLLGKSTYVCGTLRVNRKYVPKSVTRKKLKKGEVAAQQNSEGIKVIKWKDQRDVLMLTTVPEYTKELVKTGKIKRGIEREKPQCILDYNAAKKGVDYSDQMASYYSPLRKVKKWYKKGAFELLLGTAIVNSYILFNKFHTNKPISIKKFRESVVLPLLTGKPTEDIMIGKDFSPIGGKRSLHVLVELDGKCRDVRKRCRGCYELLSKNEGSQIAARKARRVKTVCGQCEGKPHLCPSCFERLHSKEY
ncbi:piggyBac transposable element-derived protein 4-like [Palaemon carinicauda]|uniref:piggyBac transposable element-derived protein 4-like n=1 Tax=Palaemon carinicauda TaxID=392227 RepID=UPI0035B5B4F8